MEQNLFWRVGLSVTFTFPGYSIDEIDNRQVKVQSKDKLELIKKIQKSIINNISYSATVCVFFETSNRAVIIIQLQWKKKRKPIAYKKYLLAKQEDQLLSFKTKCFFVFNYQEF